VDDGSRAHRTLSDTPLALNDITKRFGNTIALDSVSLAVHKGRITALLGENGAGKTTLMRIAFGMLQPDSGSIAIDGRTVRLNSPADAIAAGIGMVHQQFSLIPAMTVAENVALAGSGKYSLYATKQRLLQIAEETGLHLDPDLQVAALSSADRQKLEILRTLAHRAQVLILDEPTAVLTARDTVELFAQLKSFAREGGSVVLITHKLADAIEHADEVSVLRRGRSVLSAQMNDVNEPLLIEAMLGTAPARHAAPTAASHTSKTVAAIKYGNISLEVRAGEIVGVAALDNRATPLLRMLARRTRTAPGVTQLPRKVGFVPENRRDEALIEDFSLIENVALAGAGNRSGIIDWKAVENDATEIISQFNVVASGVSASPASLSGGNQQRFVLGRELLENPELIVLENPTQGLDVNAAAFVRDQLRNARDRGAGVIFYSSDLDELVEAADRVIVVTPAGVQAVSANRNEIGRALLGTRDG
jgi:general nucleoside transport system ATP-binding protein